MTTTTRDPFGNTVQIVEDPWTGSSPIGTFFHGPCHAPSTSSGVLDDEGCSTARIVESAPVATSNPNHIEEGTYGSCVEPLHNSDALSVMMSLINISY